ncbi:uncharacterized protein METZ01_LOCUS86812 [marine metagenome]|uniref:Uncharacterized protein n=1 Tax=marine metagenome TaxID=408172 RepID=A0A381V289_9ZZZZ
MSINDASTDSASMRNERQNVAPNCHVWTSGVVDNYHFSFGHVIDVVADRAGFANDRHGSHCERAAAQPKLWRKGLNSQALASDAETVERVTYRRC